MGAAHIFLIEDDEEDLELFKKALDEIGTGVLLDSALNGREALYYLTDKNNPTPDYIFLDLRMPGISGKQCLMEIKKIPWLANTPVIVYTTSRNMKEAKELKDLGAAHFMSKPTSPEQIYYMISMVLENRYL